MYPGRQKVVEEVVRGDFDSGELYCPTGPTAGEYKLYGYNARYLPTSQFGPRLMCSRLCLIT